MLSAKPCVEGALHQDGVAIGRVRFGDGPEDSGARPCCPSCASPANSFHHDGCLIERCGCGAHAISCGCRYDEDPPQAQDWDDAEEWADFIIRQPQAKKSESATNHPGQTPYRFPLDSETNALQFRHREVLVLLQRWIDRHPIFALPPQLLALACHGLAPHLGSDGRLRIRRSQVAQAMNRCIVLVQDLEGGIPDQLGEAMASVLLGLCELDHLDANSDPLATLLDVLSCHYGLPRAEDLPVVCRCAFDFDPFEPSSQIQLRVQTGLTVTAIAPEAKMSQRDREPLDHFVAALGESDPDWPFASLIGLRLLGTVPAAAGSPRLWLYGPPQVPSPISVLALDTGGRPFTAALDRRFRSHHRWEHQPLQTAALRLFRRNTNGQSQTQLKDQVVGSPPRERD